MVAVKWNPGRWFTGVDSSIGEIRPQNYILRWVVLTRYLLLILTAVLYLTETTSSHLWVKIGVILAVAIEAKLATNLYAVGGKGKFLVAVIMAETIGITCMILPTGGLESPLVWYGLNPIIVSAVYLPLALSWCDLILFIGSGIAASSLYPGISGSTLSFLAQQRFLLLAFLFITAFFQICARLFTCLCTAYTELAEAHEISERSLSYISSLEQALESFSAEPDRSQLAELLARYACLGGYPSACMLVAQDGPETHANPLVHMINAGDNTLTQAQWQQQLDKLWQQSGGRTVLLTAECKGSRQIIAVPVKSSEEQVGLLACLMPVFMKNEDVVKWLQLLSDLGGITLERLKNEDLWRRLLVQEEQNRIANEMHDGVAQYLFGIVCALHTLSQQNAHLQDKEVQAQLHIVEQAANHAASEMHSSIYSISPYKRGESLFLDSLASYLDKIGQLNGIQVDLAVKGSEDTLSPALSKSLHRIVREACGNAIRHGHCQSLKVRLWMNNSQTILEIEDDGCGYLPAFSITPGLGIRNMRQMVLGFNGRMEISSEPEQYTMVRCIIPGEYPSQLVQEGGFYN